MLKVPDTYHCSKLEDTEIFARTLLNYLQNNNQIKIILLSGELGAGKTTFTRFFAAELGINNHISSPSYNLYHRYKFNKDTLTHIDLYRLNSGEEFELGLDELIEDSKYVICEWWKNSQTFFSYYKDISLCLEFESLLNEEERNIHLSFLK